LAKSMMHQVPAESLKESIHQHISKKLTTNKNNRLLRLKKKRRKKTRVTSLGVCKVCSGTEVKET